MAIWEVQLDTRDFGQNRKRLKDKGFISANYFSANGFNLQKMRQFATEGKMDAMRCISGKSIRWYYSEKQAELAHIRGYF
jgi:hypothetical protein